MDRDDKPSRGGCPGALLRDRVLPALNLTVTQAARDLQVTRQTLHRILSGHAAITPDMAMRLEKLCGVSCQFWLERQRERDLKRVAQEIEDLIPRIPSHVLPPKILESIGFDGTGGNDG